MAGIDYSLAGIDVREKFSFTKTTLNSAYERLLNNENILGAVIISTCNRTEIYISVGAGVDINPFEILCEAAGVDFSLYDGLYKSREGSAVIRHLCGLACGIESQIFGEDQIISQVKNSILSAREVGAADSTLEVLFRSAVSAAKKVKSTIRFECRDTSVAKLALEVIQNDGAHENILVIGNGEIGRLTAEALLSAGLKVTMTLRQYRHGTNIIPVGADIVDYGARYEKMSDCDAVISATLSPHHTVELEELRRLERFPKLFIDLAVPRDIDRNIGAQAGVKLYDIDTLAGGAVSENRDGQRLAAERIIEKYAKDYEHWCSFKEGLVRV